MRTIKFRGKRIDNDEWVYGFLYQLELLPYGGLGTMILTDDDNCENDDISPFNLAFRKGVDLFMVDPATVGQFTGLTDKNGLDIYEGDILSCDSNIRHLVVYDSSEGRFKAVMDGEHKLKFGIVGLNSQQWLSTKYVIGNVFDNPDMVKGGKP